MKKIRIIAAAALLAVALTGCRFGVSQAAYRSLQDERDDLARQVKELESRLSDIQSATTTVATAARETTAATTAKAAVKLYGDKQVTVYFEGCESGPWYTEGKQIVFTVENKTNNTLTVQAESISLDGQSIPSRYTVMSDDVAPKSEGKVYLTVMEVDIPMEPKTISGELRIFDDVRNRIAAKFINVQVG